MAKKLKDYYDIAYCRELGQKIQGVYPTFSTEQFVQTIAPRLELLEFNDRQVLIAQALKTYLPEAYEQALQVLTKILGKELEGNLGMFSEGWWLWPVGKFVELYGEEHFELSTAFSKELTKRFTGEFCMRPLLAHFPERTLRLMQEWSKDENMRVRRLSSECLRIALPWAKKVDVVLQHFELYRMVLSNLKDDADKSIQKSVANNLNDLYKVDPQKFATIVHDWETSTTSAACAWIIQHGSRTLRKRTDAPFPSRSASDGSTKL